MSADVGTWEERVGRFLVRGARPRFLGAVIELVRVLRSWDFICGQRDAARMLRDIQSGLSERRPDLLDGLDIAARSVEELAERNYADLIAEYSKKEETP